MTPRFLPSPRSRQADVASLAAHWPSVLAVTGGRTLALSPFLHPFAKPAATDFITIVRGEGAAVFDDAGRRYVDGLASLWYCNVGHGRPEIIDAVTRQMQVLENYNTFDIFTNRAGRGDLGADLGAQPGPRCPGLPDRLGFRGGRHRAQAGPAHLQPAGPTRSPDPGRAHARLPRRQLRRRVGAGPARSTSRAGATCSGRWPRSTTTT